MQLNYKNLAFWIMIIVVIILGIYLIYWVNSESSKCISSPGTYFVSHIKSSTGEFYCTCGAIGNPNTLTVTKDNMTVSNLFSG